MPIATFIRPLTLKRLIPLMLGVVTLTGCATVARTGTEFQPVAASFAAIADDRPNEPGRALGEAMGAYIARRLGGEMPGDDAAYHDAAAQRAVWGNSEGYGETWRNPHSGDSGFIKPSSQVFRNGDALCRHFHDQMRQTGRPVLGVDGVACLRDGGWTVDY